MFFICMALCGKVSVMTIPCWKCHIIFSCHISLLPYAVPMLKLLTFYQTKSRRWWLIKPRFTPAHS